MAHIWDYDEKELQRTEEGRIKILERKLNYGTGNKEKIKLAEVKKYWDKLHLYPTTKRLLELLIWGKYSTSPENNNSFSIK